MDFNNQNVSIYACQFEAFVEKAKVQIKFPCNYFLQWKANNGKVIVSSPNRFQAGKSQILFHQTLKINVNMLFDKISGQYLKKESLLMINLISKSRPDQVKLVGRVSVDLADVLNSKSFENVTTLQLEYCSVEASMNFCVKSVSVKQSSMHVSELDRSSFNEYMSFQSNLKPHQGFIPRNEGSSTHRDFDDDRSANASEKGEIRSLDRDKNKMSSPTLMKTMYTPNNRQVGRAEGSIQQQNKINRSNSVTNQLQNPNKMFPPPLNKAVDAPVALESESNFSFNKEKVEDVNTSMAIKQKMFASESKQKMTAPVSKQRMTTSHYLNNEDSQKSAVSSKVRSLQPLIPKEVAPIVESNQKPRDLRISVEKAELASQNMPKTERVSSVLSPEQTQEDLLKRIKKDDGAISQREAVIRKLEQQVQTKRHIIPLELSFTSSAKETNVKRLSAELSQTISESKRIIGLTEALNQMQIKYTALTLETEEMRSAWKRQKQDILSSLSIAEGAINFKDREITEKAKVNEILQLSLQQAEKCASQRLAEVIYIKSQFSESQKNSNQLTEDKKKLEANLKRVEQQIRSLQRQTSLSQDQLNRTFGDRLTVYQEKITQAESKLNQSQKESKMLSEKAVQLQRENCQLKQKMSALEDENISFMGQIEQSNNEFLRVNEENEGLKKEILRKEKEGREERERIWQTKDEEVSHQLKLKNEQIDRTRQELEARIVKVQEDGKRELQKMRSEWEGQVGSLKESQSKMGLKVEQLQNTILSLNDQLSLQGNRIVKLQQQLNEKSAKLQEISQAFQNVEQEKRFLQGEHEELMLALNGQIEEQNGKIHQLESEITEAQQLLQKSLSGQQLLSQELQLTRAQSTIYESKLLEQREYYENQTQSLKLECSQQVYETEIELQEQLEKYQELEHIKVMLKLSLEEWQNKCTDDRIASSKIVSKLNDIIKEKEQTMYEMENIMRILEKDKLSMQQHLIQQTTNYHQVLSVYNAKHLQLKSLVQTQETQCIALYQAVKQHRQQNKVSANAKQLTIQQLETSLQTSNTTISELKSEVEGLHQSIKYKQSLLVENKSLTEEKVAGLKNEHNQEVDEYEERIRELQQKMTEKDQELFDREMALTEQEKIIQHSKIQLASQAEQVSGLVQKEASLNEHINALNQQINALNVEKQEFIHEKEALVSQTLTLKVRLQEETQRYAQLQTTLIECEETQKQARADIEQEKQQLSHQLSSYSEIEQKHFEKMTALEAKFNNQLQMMKETHSRTLQELSTQQTVKRQELTDRVAVIQEQKLKINQTILQKTTLLQVFNEQKAQLEQQLLGIKSQRETQVLLGYKQSIERQKQQVKSLNEQLLQARTQLKQIPALERAIKIKTIELNSFKYKSSSNPSPASDSEQVAGMQEIIRLKNQENLSLKKENESMRHHQLQLYQLQSLKQELYLSIDQYEQQKFHLNSQLNQRQITITELKLQIAQLSTTKSQLKQQIHQLTEKIHYYETLIIDFKGHNEMSSTKSHSDKLNTSRISSGKLIQVDAQNSSNSKIQLDTFFKKIKLLQTQINKLKSREQLFLANQQQHIQQINNLNLKITTLEQTILQKDTEIHKKSTAKQPLTPVKPQVTYKNPQQVAQTFKEIQNLLKKRSEFHTLESTLLKVHQINFKQSVQSQKQDHQTKQKLLTTGAHISLLSKEFQNLKAKIMKLEGKNYQEKAKFISLLRPCEDSLREVSKLYESTDSSRHSSFQVI